MKKILVVGLLSFAFLSYGQRKELRQAEKLLDQSFYNEALNVLSQIEPMIDGVDQKYQAHYYYLEGWALKGDSKFNESVASLKKAIEIDNKIKLNKYAEESSFLIEQVEADLVNSAVADNKKEDYKSASKKLYDAYLINPDKENNINYLYYAASSAVNAKEYDISLEYYLFLKNMGYTGITSEFFVTPVESGIEEKVTETEYNLFKSSKDYTNPRIGKTESRLPEIVKNIALIYVQKGEVDLAISAIKEAREINPEDVNLLLSEADLYIKLGDKLKFKELMQEAITKDPNNAILYYNLGVINGDQGKFEDAMTYYKKALELDNSYAPTYLNIVGLILEGESGLVEKMNAIVTSNKRSDQAIYDALELERENLYNDCLPYLEKLIEIDPKNIEALKTAKNIYYTVGENEKFKLMNARIQDLENQ
ncbi:MAG: tetratricopeptide repeat protein [Flavobacteriaceae bacterium]|nr:tetratricopeptide repeat protein [Flavobacteriaceae bacterium]MBT3753574.1 tetratricopeptide repeat protein [Flavobacteriaceae bacterium]MBT3793714.1 tetratricopeptide repeat protein [Flavobacteriaceae bacterium]MBT4415575.1 tetratricopeptide repeat protein [Flavobacteriaceae bacterium]MBT5595852.1 tetratricopeptide repeat protein [Flavobacteriaceae bacterium]